MEHIRQFDWCYSQPDVSFLKEEDFEHSVTEKILRNKFRDPLISSDSDEEKPSINWEKVFSENQNGNKTHRLYVPGMRPPPPYPKLSTLTRQQQYQCLKVLSYQNPHVLELEFIPRPTKSDYKLFDELKETYEKEQKEYIEWAKLLWTTNHCVRALRPKPPVETVYEARFKMRANEFESYPKNYVMAAQLPLECTEVCEMVHVKDLINIDKKNLVQIKCDPLTSHMTIMKHCSVPEPCNKHRCRFILPNEKTVSELPLMEVQRELAQYAADNGAQFIASESALKCLVELDQPWQITVSVCEVFGPDGETKSVVVLGSDFSTRRESVLMRTYRAFKHLLENALVSPSEKMKIIKNNEESNEETIDKDQFLDAEPDSSDDEDGALCIVDEQLLVDIADEDSDAAKNTEESRPQSKKDEQKGNESSANVEKNCFYSCTCKETYFEKPPPRSYRKWQLRNKDSGQTFDMIVHCSHRVKDEKGEVILEPIPEYQLDLGASQPTTDHMRTLLLALRLRSNAALLSARIDNGTGDLVTLEWRSRDELTSRHKELLVDVNARLHCACVQLNGLRTGCYVLKHDPVHGANAMLYVANTCGKDLVLKFDSLLQPEADDAKYLKTAPTLAPILLPVHKYRKILPCAFSPYENQLKPQRSQPPRQKTPPQALKLAAGAVNGDASSKWPKKRRKNKKKQ